MRATLFALFVTVSQVIATGTYSQNTRLSLNLKNVTIRDAMLEIENKSDYYFMYDATRVNVNRKIDVVCDHLEIKEILNKVFQETGITYEINNRQIALNILSDAFPFLQARKTITGKVTDSSGASLPGVSVVIKGSTQGTITAADGSYVMTNIEESASLVFSFVGMRTREVPVAERTVINVALEEETIGIEEVVAIGYGTQRKVDLTGSVSQVSSDEFERAPVADALQAMQGKVPGVQIISNSGAPGATQEIRIRGVQSWGASTTPLYVIDGVIMDNLNSVNTNDIESISILKDAASSAIYGARAANGVILITTKRGSASGLPTIAFHAYAGVQQYSDLQPKLLNSTQWLMLDKESYMNAGESAYNQSPYGTQNPVDLSIFNDWKGNLTNTDWLDVIGQPGRVQNYDLSIRGGNEKSSYYTGITYFKQDGLIMETWADKIGIRFNSDHKIAKFIEFGNSLNIYSNSRHGGVGNPYLEAISKNPLSRPYETDENGEIIGYDYVRSYTIEGGNVGPLILAKEYTDDTRVYGFAGNVFLKVKLLDGLTFMPRLSIDYRNVHNSTFTPELHITGVETQSINNVTKQQDYTFHWIADYMLNYEKTFNGTHHLSASAIYSQEESSFEYISGIRFGTPNNEIRYLNAGQLENQNVENGYEDWSFVSYIGRINYNYKEKYFLQGSVRRDGTSRFVEDNRWGVFPSASAGWRISKERFFEPFTPIVNNLKIRGSFGTLGNSNVGLYPTFATLDSYTYPMGPESGQTFRSTYALMQAVNTNLKWESTFKRDIGLDAGFFNSRLTLTADYYKSNTTNLLYGRPLPLSAGKTSDPTVNGGEIQNTGFEFDVVYQDKKGDFSYSIDANLATARNKVLDLNGRDIREWGLEVGQPIYREFGYTSNGIVKNQAILDAHPYLTNPANDFPIGLGDIWTVDVNGRDENGDLTGKPDGKITADDRGFIGKKYPDFTYGISANLAYKRWSLQIVTYGVHGIDLNTMVDINGYFQYTSNDVVRVLDRWEATKNPDGNMPKVTKDDKASNASATSSFWLSDASYWKISNVNLQYAVPQSICQRLNMKSLDIYGSVQNLHTFTSYPGGEVDVTDEGMWAQPVTKIPQPRTWILGVKVSF